MLAYPTISAPAFHLLNHSSRCRIPSASIFLRFSSLRYSSSEPLIAPRTMWRAPLGTCPGACALLTSLLLARPIVDCTSVTPAKATPIDLDFNVESLAQSDGLATGCRSLGLVCMSRRYCKR